MLKIYIEKVKMASDQKEKECVSEILDSTSGVLPYSAFFYLMPFLILCICLFFGF